MPIESCGRLLSQCRAEPFSFNGKYLIAWMSSPSCYVDREKEILNLDRGVCGPIVLVDVCGLESRRELMFHHLVHKTN